MPEWFQHARSRPLSAEELVESWQVATGYLATERPARKKAEPDRFRPLGSGYFVQFFGNPNTGTGDFQGGLREHLYLNNGPLGQMIRRRRAAWPSSSATRRSRWPSGSSGCSCTTLNRRPTRRTRRRSSPPS